MTNVMILRDNTFKRWVGQENFSLVNEFMAHIKEIMQSIWFLGPYTLGHVRKHWFSSMKEMASRCHCGSREQSSPASQISSCSDLGPPMLQKWKKNHFCPKQNILPRVLCHGNTNRIRQQDITFHSNPVQLLNLGWQMMWKHKRKSKLLSKALLYVTKTGWQRVLLIAHSGTQFASFMFTWASKDLK